MRDLVWFKSSYSGGNEGDSCIEVALAPALIHIRDSKNPGDGPTFHVAAGAWVEFVSYVSGV
ncbi:DUF397 domain-containing protein [Streptomyces sp. NPDC005811]|uniref:DUF397 domain-containing protein n=1 Tax=Streptomyces sp. NPDC005811 TaxID=3154565 RepID=UPI0033E1598A